MLVRPDKINLSPLFGSPLFVSSLVANALLVKLRSAFPVSDYPQIASWLAPLEGFAQAGLAAREGNVTNINVQGEFLSVPPATLDRRAA